MKFDLVIIGAGPAGLTASIYAKRAGLTACVIEAEMPGGKLIKTYEIENYPGVKKMAGVDLANTMFEQASSFGVEFVFQAVTEIKKGEKEHTVIVQDGTEITGGAILIATGTKERLLNIPGEQEYSGKGVSYCAVCDGFFYKDKVVTVIGGGNSAVEEAHYLTQFAKEVRIVIRRDVFRAEQRSQDALLERENVTVVKKHIPVSIQGEDGKVSSITLKNVETGEETVYQTDGIFPYIGSDPITSFCKNLDILDEHGYVKVNENMETSIPGIYAAGDVISKYLRQVVTACNDGAIAAQQIYHYLKG